MTKPLAKLRAIYEALLLSLAFIFNCDWILALSEAVPESEGR